MRLLLVALIGALAACVPAGDTVGPGDRIGVVLMHGKGGSPKRFVATLAASLRDAGVLVETPLMPWGQGRIYDRNYEDSLAEIDGWVARLKADGAVRIVVAGHSMGGNAALGYGATRDGIDGVIVLAPGHTPESPGFQARLDGSVARAGAMIDAGRGAESAVFKDVKGRAAPDAETTAAIYYSWFSPDGPAAIHRNTTGLKPGTALLWVDGAEDRLSKIYGKGYAFDHAPENARNRYVLIDAGHLAVPGNAVKVVLEWLKAL